MNSKFFFMQKTTRPNNTKILHNPDYNKPMNKTVLILYA